MTLLCTYSYDPLDRIATLSPLAQAVTRRFYCERQMVSELQGSVQRTLLQADGRLLAQLNRDDDGGSIDLIATDQQNSAVRVSAAGQQTDIAYSPYGHREADVSGAMLSGFTGAQPDRVTGHYLLGNGYRAFNPTLMRFNSPDSLSPFGKGGLNAYAYCAGDPINRIDSTGHMRLGIRTSLYGVFVIASGITLIVLSKHQASDSNQEIPTAGIVVGSIGTALGIGFTGFSAYRAFSRSSPLRPSAPPVAPRVSVASLGGSAMAGTRSGSVPSSSPTQTRRNVTSESPDLRRRNGSGSSNGSTRVYSGPLHSRSFSEESPPPAYEELFPPTQQGSPGQGIPMTSLASQIRRSTRDVGETTV
ncbi:hypothetical protein BZK31_10380 [Pseudomonas floridensis]|uniref:RHS repeat-associated core domain-containing protein n=2 Tax=Pseudomonas floridensis TaxID=1958950 RepID=A0A1X0N782_9PSED|nr:hypothetical protein BZK31_10380 [Pseudomonas floridensis]